MPKSSNLYVAQGDIKDYFYACGIDPQLSEYFCLPPIDQEEMTSLALSLPGMTACGASPRIFPQLAVMPMGWSWAF